MKESRVFFTVSQLKIVTAQHVLNEAGIASVVLNKLDSAHAGVFGDIELYVDENDAEKAKELLSKEEII